MKASTFIFVARVYTSKLTYKLNFGGLFDSEVDVANELTRFHMAKSGPEFRILAM